MNYLTLQIQLNNETGWNDVELLPGQEISMEENSPVWDEEASSFSEEFDIPVEPNAWLGNLESMRGEDVYRLLYGCRFRLFVCGVPFKRGIVRLDDTVEIAYDEAKDMHTVTVELTSAHGELNDLLDGVKLTDLPLYNYDNPDDSKNIRIGVALERDGKLKILAERGVQQYNLRLEGPNTDKSPTLEMDGDRQMTDSRLEWSVQLPSVMLPRYDFGGGDEIVDELNDSHPYDPEHPYKYPYCNVRVCSQKYKGQSSDKLRGYHVGPADRVNTAPCFFVPFVLHKICDTEFTTKTGFSSRISMSENALEQIPDFLRMALFHTTCHYRMKDANAAFDARDVNRDKVEMDYAVKVTQNQEAFRKVADGKYEGVLWYFPANSGGELVPSPDNVYTYTSLLRASYAYATEENLPDVDVKTFIDTVCATFCARFVYDSMTGEARIVLVRDVLSQDASAELPCQVLSAYSEHDIKRGFRLKYEGAPDIYENPITKRKVIIGSDDDKNGSSVETSYDYNDYRDVVSFDASSKTDGYLQRFGRLSPYDKQVYVDNLTGDVYRVKVDKDADLPEQLYPSLFEVSMYGPVEYGDCSVDEFVEEVTLGFTPITPNDVNIENERTYGYDPVDVYPMFAQFVVCEIHDKDDGSKLMECENFDFLVAQETSEQRPDIPWLKPHSGDVKVNLAVSMNAVESYKLENGNPYDGVDTGFSMGILRDSDLNAAEELYGVEDEEGNSTWTKMQERTGEFTSDSIDQYGEPLCVHGTMKTVSVSRANVESVITDYFADSNADLTAVSRRVSWQEMWGQGYHTQFMSYSTYYSMSTRMQDSDGISYEVLFTPISDNGEVYSKNKIYAYLRHLQGCVDNGDGSLLDLDRSLKRVIIGMYDSAAKADRYGRFLSKLGQIYYDNVGVQQTIDGPEIDKLEQGLSLKLKAQKKNPYHGASETNPKYGRKNDPWKELCDDDGYFLADTKHARRGLFDQYYSEYAYWVVNRRVAHLQCEMELADLMSLDFTKRYRIGEYVGFLKSVKYSISDDGLSDVDIELYYLI